MHQGALKTALVTAALFGACEARREPAAPVVPNSTSSRGGGPSGPASQSQGEGTACGAAELRAEAGDVRADRPLTQDCAPAGADAGTGSATPPARTTAPRLDGL